MAEGETLLVTGGTGFVMSNLVRRWLADDPAARVLVLDAAPWDAALERFFGPLGERLTFVQANIAEPATWQPQLDAQPISLVVHGATITPSFEREQAQPREIIAVNTMGTLELLEWARKKAGLRRFMYVSSGAVYGEAPPGTPPTPHPEDGYVGPIELYGISKYASELITRRYGELFGLDVVSVRFSGVYGPMDRATPGRSAQSMVYRLVHLAAAGQPLTVSDLDAGGDWIHADDVARALIGLLHAPRLRFPVYNVAYGEFVTLGAMLSMLHAELPALHASVVVAGDATIVQAAQQRLGRWNAYDIARVRDEIGWSPRPLAEGLQSYLRWVREEEG